MLHVDGSLSLQVLGSGGARQGGACPQEWKADVGRGIGDQGGAAVPEGDEVGEGGPGWRKVEGWRSRVQEGLGAAALHWVLLGVTGFASRSVRAALNAK